MAQPINRRSDSNVGRIVLFCLAAVVLLLFAWSYILVDSRFEAKFVTAKDNPLSFGLNRPRFSRLSS